MKLTAMRRIRHAGRHVDPGEMFDIRSASEAKALKALGHAVDYVEPPPDEREPLRARAAALGVAVDGRWSVARLNEEITAAEKQRAAQQQGYMRRDMRAEGEGK